MIGVGGIDVEEEAGLDGDDDEFKVALVLFTPQQDGDDDEEEHVSVFVSLLTGTAVEFEAQQDTDFDVASSPHLLCSLHDVVVLLLLLQQEACIDGKTFLTAVHGGIFPISTCNDKPA
mmetsp:Transcript_8997/g.12808  ORF Transcript_8997/g.12808 Transcript_8997/m.12808 type:complete len:118 (-) Transcript_8997:67-420(-)